MAGIFLFVMMFTELNKKKIPAVVGTTGILACVLLLWTNPSLISFGIAGFLFAYLLYEFGALKGRAEIKAMILIGLTIVSIGEFFVFMIIIAMLGVIYPLIFTKAFKIKHQEDIPLILMFFLTWAILLFV